MTALSGDHPKYIGWVPINRVMARQGYLYKLTDDGLIVGGARKGEMIRSAVSILDELIEDKHIWRILNENNE